MMMGDKNLYAHNSRSRKPVFCFFSLVTLLCVSSWFFLLDSTSRPSSIRQSLLSNPKLLSTTENQELPPGNWKTGGLSLDQDGAVYPDNNGPLEGDQLKCDPSNAIMKVFMYDLPPEFHFGLLDWKPEGNKIWPDITVQIPPYPGGLNLQHSIEYWLTLDLLSSRLPDRKNPCTAVRVDSSLDADIIFVPFFSSLSYNRHSKVKPPANVSTNKLLQDKLVNFLINQNEWKRSGGRDHVILAHHPNSMMEARTKLWHCLFILADFGRYPPNVANVEKDVIAPYKHVIKGYPNDSSTFDDRPTLLFFQGAIYRKDGGFIRQELYYLLKDEKDVHFTFGSVRENGVNQASQGMHSSKYCLNIAGDTPSSNRLFDAIASHCVPVIISDEIELPYEDVLDYSQFCVFVRTSDALKKGFLIKLIRSIGREEWTRMWNKLKEVEGYFEFHYPSRKDDAVQMIWQAIARKVPAITFKLNRSRRFTEFSDR